MAGPRAWHLLAATHLAAGIAGYAIAPKELLDSEVAHTGLFSVDRKRTLAAAVLSVRRENKLLVWTYRGAAHVTVERSELLGLARGRQTLTVPATVGYYVDLSQLSEDDLHWDEAAGLATVRLPKLVMGEIAFHVEAAHVINGGLLTISDRQVQELTALSFRQARATFIRASQDRTLVEIAERQAKANVEHLFVLPLRSAGLGEVKVVATFANP